MLSCILALKHFAPLVHGEPLKIYSDSKTVCSQSESKEMSLLAPKMLRMRLWISAYGVDRIHFKPGSQNYIADFCSRVVEPAQHVPEEEPSEEIFPRMADPEDIRCLVTIVDHSDVQTDNIQKYQADDPIISKVMEIVGSLKKMPDVTQKFYGNTDLLNLYLRFLPRFVLHQGTLFYVGPESPANTFRPDSLRLVIPPKMEREVLATCHGDSPGAAPLLQ